MLARPGLHHNERHAPRISMQPLVTYPVYDEAIVKYCIIKPHHTPHEHELRITNYEVRDVQYIAYARQRVY